MATINVAGKVYPQAGLLQDSAHFATELATKARIIAPLLPSGIDLDQSQVKAIAEQVNAMSVLPEVASSMIWNSFAAKYLGDLATALKSFDPKTQRTALSVGIFILSMMPDPRFNLYFRRFLRNSPLALGIPNLVGESFAGHGRSIEWIRPGGPDQLCTLMVRLLFWASTLDGDDGKASMDLPTRERLRQKLEVILENPRISELPGNGIQRLHGALKLIDETPGASYLNSTREFEQGPMDVCHYAECVGEGKTLTLCSRCKTQRYCSKGCQTADWKEHKPRCFQVAWA